MWSLRDRERLLARWLRRFVFNRNLIERIFVFGNFFQRHHRWFVADCRFDVHLNMKMFENHLNWQPGVALRGPSRKFCVWATQRYSLHVECSVACMLDAREWTRQHAKSGELRRPRKWAREHFLDDCQGLSIWKNTLFSAPVSFVWPPHTWEAIVHRWDCRPKCTMVAVWPVGYCGCESPSWNGIENWVYKLFLSFSCYRRFGIWSPGFNYSNLCLLIHPLHPILVDNAANYCNLKSLKQI